MANNKSGPPWLLAVFTVALLMLVLGALARYGDRAPHSHRGGDSNTRPTVQRDVRPRFAAAPASAGIQRPAAAPASAGIPRLAAAPASVGLQRPAAAPASTEVHALASPAIDDGFSAEVVGGTQSAAYGPHGRRGTPAGYADRETSRKVLPWITEGAVALLIGITLGFLTRKELIAVAGVSTVVGLAVGVLEYFGHTHIAFSALWEMNRDYVIAGMTDDNLANIVQKGATVLLAGGGYVMGTKG